MKKQLILLCGILFFTFQFYSKSQSAMPEWVLNWQTVYPDSEYIAQKGTGKKSDEAKNEAAAHLSQYFETSVNSTRESNYKSLESQTNGKYKLQIEQEIKRETKVESNTVLNAVEYTEPWYNKKDKTWHCVAYINRKTIWNKYEPTLRVAKDNFMSFYNKANEQTEAFERIKSLSNAVTEGFKFLDSVSYAQFLSESLTSSYSNEEIQIFSSLERQIQDEKDKCPLYVFVTGDSGNVIYSSLVNSLTKSGFTVVSDKAKSVCLVETKCLVQTEKNEDLIVFSPSILIEIKNKNQTLFSYSRDCKRIKAYTEANGNKKSLESVSKTIDESFLEEFNSALSGNK